MITTILIHIVHLFPLISLTIKSLPVITDQPVTDLDRDVYGQRLGSFAEFLDGESPSAPNLSDFDASQYTTGSELFPAWRAERNIPLSKEIEEQQKLGLQGVLMRNLVRLDVACHLVPVYL